MLLSSTVSVSRSISTEILTSRHNPFMAPSFSFFIASISPLVPVLQVGSWPLSWLFSREKVRKSSFERLWYLHYLFINSPCSVWSNLIALLFPRPTRSVSSGWAFFPLLIILLSRSVQRTAYWLVGRSHLDHWTYPSHRFSVSHHLVHHQVIQHPSNVMELLLKKERPPPELVRISSFLFPKSLTSNGISITLTK